jgi:hypothetical protein
MTRIDEEKRVVNFNEVPEAAEKLKSATYQQGFFQKAELPASRSSDALKGRDKPVGGAPPLDPNKMAALAMARPSFSEDDDVGGEDPPPVTLPKGLGGVGAAYPINQDMAAGKLRSPVSVAAARKAGKLSPETQKLMQMAVQPEEEPAAQEEPASQEEEAAPDTRAPEFDFGQLQAARNELMSDARRETIEKRLQPLRIEDMITHRELSQEVPVIPGRLHFTFRTFSQREYLFCLQYIFDFPGSAMYSEELLSTCKLACSIVAVNGALLPDHRKSVGKALEEVDKAAFAKKLDHLSSFPVQMIADMSVQASWFNGRVNKLFSVDTLKNG